MQRADRPRHRRSGRPSCSSWSASRAAGPRGPDALGRRAAAGRPGPGRWPPSPAVLLLDEPLGALDRPLRERLVDELRGLFRRLGLTVVAVTHDQPRPSRSPIGSWSSTRGGCCRRAPRPRSGARPPPPGSPRCSGSPTWLRPDRRGRTAPTPWGDLGPAVARCRGRPRAAGGRAARPRRTHRGHRGRAGHLRRHPTPGSACSVAGAPRPRGRRARRRRAGAGARWSGSGSTPRPSVPAAGLSRRRWPCPGGTYDAAGPPPVPASRCRPPPPCPVAASPVARGRRSSPRWPSASRPPSPRTGRRPPTTEPPDDRPADHDSRRSSSTTTTTTVPADPTDPGGGEALPEEPVPVVPTTVPAPPAAEVERAYGAAGRADRAAAAAAWPRPRRSRCRRPTSRPRTGSSSLEAELDELEARSPGWPPTSAPRCGGWRPPGASSRPGPRPPSSAASPTTSSTLVATDDPNELAIAQTLLGSVLDADDQAVREYLAAKRRCSADLVGVAERLVDARLELEAARARLVEARRASVAAQFNLAVFAAGSEIVIHGFVFPVGDPHTFGDSFGAPRMMGTGLRARPPGHGHHGARSARRSWPASGGSSPRWAPTSSAAPSSGSRARAARTTTTPTSARSRRASRRARWSRRATRGPGRRHRQRQGRRPAPALRDPPRRRAWPSTRTRCSRSSTSSAGRPRPARALSRGRRRLAGGPVTRGDPVPVGRRPRPVPRVARHRAARRAGRRARRRRRPGLVGRPPGAARAPSPAPSACAWCGPSTSPTTTPGSSGWSTTGRDHSAWVLDATVAARGRRQHAHHAPALRRPALDARPRPAAGRRDRALPPAPPRPPRR